MLNIKHYTAYGIKEFIVCLGHKGYLIKEYFANYFLHVSDVTFDLKNNSMEVHEHNADPWKVTLIDTGENSQTGGRLKYVVDHLGVEDFCLTYSDALSNVNIEEELKFHKAQGNLVTLTAVKPPTKYGSIMRERKKLFAKEGEKFEDEEWVNGGFYVLSPKALNYIDGNHIPWEGPPLEKLAHENNLSYFHHDGFWQNVDTLGDIAYLENLWQANTAHWKIW